MDESRTTSTELDFAVFVPPPVPVTRGPSLPNGRRPPGGPPRRTPSRSVQRYGVRRVADVCPPRLVPSSCDSNGNKETTGNNNNCGDGGNAQVWSSESVATAMSTGSVVFEAESPPLPGHLLHGRRHHQSLGAPDTTTVSFSSPSKSCSSVCFEVVSDARLHMSRDHDNDDAESLPSALPPPKPYPSVRPSPAATHHHPARTSPVKRLVVESDGGNATGGNIPNPKDVNKSDGPQQLRGDSSRKAEEKKKDVDSVERVMSAVSVPSRLRPRTSLLRPPLYSLLKEVHGWMNVVNSVEDTDCYKLYLENTEKSLHDTQRGLEAAYVQDKEVTNELLAAKARYVECLDNYHRERNPPASSRNDGENNNGTVEEKSRKEEEEEEEEMAQEREAWRIEKGELLAEKALLLQKRKELCYHLRRGTNIKNVAALALSEGNTWSMIDSSTPRTANGNNDNSNSHTKGDAASQVNDFEIIQLRLEMKEAQVHMMKLVDSHRILQGFQRRRLAELQDEYNRLRQSFNEINRDVENNRSSLEATLKKAEQVRGKCTETDEESLGVLLEHRVAEARAALKPRDGRSSVHISSSSGGDTPRTPRLTIRRASSAGSSVRRVSGTPAYSSTTTPSAVPMPAGTETPIINKKQKI